MGYRGKGVFWSMRAHCFLSGLPGAPWGTLKLMKSLDFGCGLGLITRALPRVAKISTFWHGLCLSCKKIQRKSVFNWAVREIVLAQSIFIPQWTALARSGIFCQIFKFAFMVKGLLQLLSRCSPNHNSYISWWKCRKLKTVVIYDKIKVMSTFWSTTDPQMTWKTSSKAWRSWFLGHNNSSDTHCLWTKIAMHVIFHG